MFRELHPESAPRVWGSLLEFRRHGCAVPAAAPAVFGAPASSEEPTDDVVGFTLDADRGWSFTDRFEPQDERPSLRVALRDGTEPLAAEYPPTCWFSHPRYRAGLDPIVGGEAFPDPGALTAYRLYLPLLLGALEARRRGGTFLTAHLAQTLDGRIACANGSSQWIGNEANLHHAHRLRALHDAVIVGGETLARDDPRLTVRHVEGTDPRRVVLSGSGRALEEEAPRLFRGEGGLVVLDEASESARRAAGHSLPEGVEVLALASDDEGVVAPRTACEALAERGLHGLFLEGGARTLSGFLAAGTVDVLHVHLAPLLLGSGIAGVQLPEVTSLEEARRVTVEYFEMDGELLVECRPGRA